MVVPSQVARQQDPQQDAAKVLAVRNSIGQGIALRADANRKWSLNQAVAFGHAVAAANLQVVPNCHKSCALLKLNRLVSQAIVTCTQLTPLSQETC